MSPAAGTSGDKLAARVRRSSVSVRGGPTLPASRPMQTSAFASPASSPSRPAEKRATATATTAGTAEKKDTLRRRPSLSVIDNQRLHTLSSSTLGKRRLEEAEDKGRGARPSTTSSAVSEFGAVDRGQRHSSKGSATTSSLKSSPSSRPRPFRTMQSSSGEVSEPRSSSLITRPSLSASSRSTLASKAAATRASESRVDTTAVAVTTTSSSPMPRPSNLPRPRAAGPSTPTRAVQERKGERVRVATACEKSVQQTIRNGKEGGTSPGQTGMPSSLSYSSVKVRAAAWGQPNGSSTPVPNQRTSVKAGKREKLDGKDEGKEQGKTGEEPVRRARRMSLVQQTSRVLRAEGTRGRRTGMISAPNPAASTPVRKSFQGAVVKAEEPAASSPSSSPMPIEAVVWGQWKAGEAPPSREGRWQNDELANMDQFDLICSPHDSPLMDGKMLEELDAEVGRLVLDESVNSVLYPDPALEEQRLRDEEQQQRLKKVENEREEQRVMQKVMQDQQSRLSEMEEQRDQAELMWIQVQAELDGAQRKIAALERDAESKDEEQRGREASLTLHSGPVEPKPSAAAESRRQERAAQTTIATLTMERILDEWKAVEQSAMSQADLFDTQSQLCRYFTTQLDVFQKALLPSATQSKAVQQ